MRYILASGSPRRKELLSKVLKEFEIIPAQGDETTDNVRPNDMVEELSFKKASEIFHKIFSEDGEMPVVIGADTVVSYNYRILGKPKDRVEARKMISSLQGDEHTVFTGVTVFYGKDGKEEHFSFSEETLVYVTSMTDEEVEAYLSTGEADDKAGAYGVQGDFGKFINGIRGDYYNVVGLPIARLYREMKKRGLL
ncbi:septum formation protein Maf [Butyrivibrio sp. X503]|uniref:Maf family protein n=1 Tax=Butyrivibrio sp. X503 TaxID=2364878 RepID=UPI000EA9D00D|nr:Maf family protein [Butyrivibrio sp. X503]RKM57344.1 septum formation protein Maf [Butyrivibrio sp. X503]